MDNFFMVEYGLLQILLESILDMKGCIYYIQYLRKREKI